MKRLSLEERARIEREVALLFRTSLDQDEDKVDFQAALEVAKKIAVEVRLESTLPEEGDLRQIVRNVIEKDFHPAENADDLARKIALAVRSGSN